jgi:hypothetical protein
MLAVLALLSHKVARKQQNTELTPTGSEGCSEERAKAEAVGGRVQRLVVLLVGT